MSETCCTRLAENTGRKNDVKTRTTLSAISSQLRHVSTIGKNLLSSNISSTCPHNMVNFGPLAAVICWRVWGTPTNFNGFCVLASLLHGIPVLGVSQTLRRWTESATYIRLGGHHVGHWPTFYFSISYGWDATRQNVSKLAAFRRGWVSLSQDFRGKGRPPANVLIPLERQLIALQLCRWQLLYNETLQQTFRSVLSKLSKRRQI